VRNRKSVSGGVLMMGTSCLRFYTKGQAVVSLSSGESEFYALVSGLSNLLGDYSLAKDFGHVFRLGVKQDASASIAMGSRRGLGKAKHIDTCFLWVQQYLASGQVRLSKVSTQDMSADCLTKPLASASLERLMIEMGFVF
jgi:hypothetical protein